MNQIFNGRYRIDGKVGDGGMAVVYRGWDTVLNRVVAVKVLREQYASNMQFLRRFQREAQSVARLAHPNIVSVYDVGRDGETWFIVMELIDGADLAAFIRERAPFTVAATTEIMAQVMSALDYAHMRGLVHRDLKPHNILIDSRGTAKVVDFGIAKDVNDVAITDLGTLLGTVAYISPEQATGVSITTASDIYSAGVIVYEMLTGRLPFTGTTGVSVAIQHVHNAPPPPTIFNVKIPHAVETVVLKAMAKVPECRYLSGAELVAALRRAATELPSAPASQSGGGIATAPRSPETSAVPVMPKTPIRVLVVEDEADIRRLIEIKLKASGFAVLTAADGKEGIAKALDERPEIMLCDVMMPGKDGYAVVREVRQRLGENAPVILMLTARGEQADMVRGLNSGADDYIVKPFNPQDLVARIYVTALKSMKQLDLPRRYQG